MKNKVPFTIQILSWCEIIMAARIFLFTVPVLVKNIFFRQPHIFEVYDWFIVVLTLTGLIYLLAGLTSLIGHKLQHIFHFCAFVLIAMMTYALFQRAQNYGFVFEYFYLSPAIFSVLITALFILIKSRIKTV